MAKPNFSFQKRQKELARQKKQEEKRQRKLEKAGRPEDAEGPVAEGSPQEQGTAPTNEENRS